MRFGSAQLFWLTVLKRQVLQRPCGAGESSVKVDPNLFADFFALVTCEFFWVHTVLFGFAGSFTFLSALKRRYFPQCEPPLLAHVN
jgi:hypothetical protein